jgi:C1A family cysteine protease
MQFIIVLILQLHSMHTRLYMDWVPLEDVSFPQFLGRGLSVPISSSEDVNHTVLVIGWGTCLIVPELDEENQHGVEGISPLECWIMQNSWGSDAGYRGFFFVNNDPKCM